jgi:MFS transporter, DHA1 family, multidrug resistance protein
MQLRPDTFLMTATLALLTALGPLSTDFYLPSLPDITRVFGTTTAGAQATLSSFLFGFAAGQVFYGPLSDRLGRKPVLAIGFGLFLIATLLCALASSIEMLIGARFVQALGASGPIVLGRAMVRDLYDGSRAGRELSRMGMIMGVVPAIAPVLGGVLHNAYGWRSTFVISWLFGACLIAWIAFAMPETLRQRQTDRLSLVAILRDFAALLENRAYRVYVLLASLTFGGLFAFISGSSFVLSGAYGLSPVAYGLSFGLSVIGFIAGTILAQRLVVRRGLDATMALGVICLMAGGAMMLALCLIGTGSSLEITLPMALYAAGVGLVLPQTQASAMMPFPLRAGAASSFLGICQMGFAAFIGLGIGKGLSFSPAILPAVIAVIGFAAFLCFHLSRRIRAG